MTASDFVAFLAGVTAGAAAVVLTLEWSAGRARKSAQASLGSTPTPDHIIHIDKRGHASIKPPSNVSVIPSTFRAEDWSA